MPKFVCRHKQIDQYAEDTYDGGYLAIQNCLECGENLRYEYVPPNEDFGDDLEDYI